MANYTDSDLNNISLEYSYEELQQATKNFDARCQLGTGSFGSVYRGLQRDGTEVAVKVLDLPDEAGFEEEVRVLSKFRHPNLVILMGFGRRDTQRFLVYELLGGGDVYQRLQQSCLDKKEFNWRQRLSSAFDAACGLSHLHNATPKVFHRDIKSPNILLDRNGTGKMADFGLACLSHASSKKVEKASGTVGYACPLYAQRQVVTEGSEVYSFGIVLLELLTASPPCYVQTQPDGGEQYQFLVSHINNNVRVAISMADPKARFTKAVCEIMADLALRCTQMPEEARPTFTSLVNTLRMYRDASDEEPSPQAMLPRPAPVQAGAEASPWWAQKQQQQQQHQVQQQQQAQAAANVGLPPPAQPGFTPHGMQAPQPIIVGSPAPCGAAAAAQAQAAGCSACCCAASQPPPQQGVPGVVQIGAMAVNAGGGHLAPSAMSRPLGQGIPRPSVPGGPGQPPTLLGAAGGQAPGVAAGASASINMPGTGVAPPSLAIRQIGTQPAGQLMINSAMGAAQPAVRYSLPPLLWTLQCVHSEAYMQLADVPAHQRSIAHHQEAGGPLPTTLRVGRLFQGEFFDNMVQDIKVRGAVSREHFQIWADQATAPRNNGAEIPCLFFLTNFSNNGTMVNGNHLGTRGENAALHHGDTIAMVRANDGVLTPFLEFRFDLTGSCLRDADDKTEAPSVQGVFTRPAAVSNPGGSVNIAARGAPAPLGGGSAALAPAELGGGSAAFAPAGGVGESNGHGAAQLAAPVLVSPPPPLVAVTSRLPDGTQGTSFLAAEVSPIFVLEAGGSAIRDGLPPEHRRIVHGPLLDPPGAHCPPLLLGRALQSEFWPCLLVDRAYNALSRHHLQLEVFDSDDGTVGFFVRNLSDRNPIRVCPSPEEGALDAALPLDKDEERLLHHGDVIVMNPNRGSTLWLTFRDLVNRKPSKPGPQVAPPSGYSTSLVPPGAGGGTGGGSPVADPSRARRSSSIGSATGYQTMDMSPEAPKAEHFAAPTIRLAAPAGVINKLRSETPERCPNDTR